MVTEGCCNIRVRKDWEKAAPGGEVSTGSLSHRRPGTCRHHRWQWEPQEVELLQPGNQNKTHDEFVSTLTWRHLTVCFLGYIILVLLDKTKRRKKQEAVRERGGLEHVTKVRHSHTWCI